jgi:hypothetical protein
MNKFREWSFPIVLIGAWVVAAAYALSLMIGPPDRPTPAQSAPPAASAPRFPAS